MKNLKFCQKTGNFVPENYLFSDVPLKQKTAILSLAKPITNAIFGVFEHKGSRFVFCVNPIVDAHTGRFACLYLCSYSVSTNTGTTITPKLRVRTQDDTPKLAEYLAKELFLLAQQGRVMLRKGNVPKRLVSEDVVKQRKRATAAQRNSSGAILRRKCKGQGHVDPLRSGGANYAYIDASRKIYGCTVNVNNHRCIMSESIAYYMDGTGVSVYGDNRDRRPLEQGWHQNSYKNKK